jgi:hypothetical protein
MMLARLFGGKTTVTALEHDLLDSIRPTAIADPQVLRERLAALHTQIDATEREWDALDARAGDPRAFLARQPVAERLQELREQAAPLAAAIESAERRRAAFLALVRLFDSVTATVAAQTQALLFQAPQDAADRARQLRALDQSTRLHVRLAHRLAAVSSSPTFHEPADALALLRDTYAEQIRQCDLLRLPGHKPRFEWPPAMTEWLDVMEDRERTTA